MFNVFMAKYSVKCTSQSLVQQLWVLPGDAKTDQSSNLPQNRKAQVTHQMYDLLKKLFGW